MVIYAKSDGTTLADHTRDVVAAVRAVVGGTMRDSDAVELPIAEDGAVIHDMGKAHPQFRRSLEPGYDPRSVVFEVPHRHEISSLLFLPLFPRQEWSALTDMVIAHHKSLRAIGADRGRGLLDLLDAYGAAAVFERHFERWEEWYLDALAVLKQLGTPVRPLDRQDALSAFCYVVDHCERLGCGRSRLRGLLMAADHLASALGEDTTIRASSLYRAPDLSPYQSRSAVADPELFPLSARSAASPLPHTLVVAPTGAGKTDFLMRRCGARRVFYLLPFQASINAMYLRMEQMLNGAGSDRCAPCDRIDIRRVHASSALDVDGGGLGEERVLQGLPGAAIKIMTPYQIAAIVLGLPGHEAIALDVEGQAVVLDEVHVYSDQAQSLALEIVRAVLGLGCTVHIGSATIPSALTATLLDCLGGDTNVDTVRLTAPELASYDRHLLSAVANEDEARALVAQWVRAGKRVLFVSNRVTDAQARYQWVREAFPDVEAMLIHSRYRRIDRAILERRITALEASPGPCVVCSTQVIEVSLDISFDALATDCAPLDSLVQRFGRVNRRRVDLAKHAYAPVAVIKPPDNATDARPYTQDVLSRTWAVLGDGGVVQEGELQRMIDTVYPTVSLAAIDTELVERDGAFILPELCNRPRSVLLEVMEIDSASVVAESDVSRYMAGKADVRQGLEIPVPWRSLWPVRDAWRQLQVGSHPFVCPDARYDAMQGLTIAPGDRGCTIL